MAGSQASVKDLTAILLDPNSETVELDDAAMYLGEYDSDEALKALITYAHKDFVIREGDETVKYSCGESIAQIWIKRGYFDEAIYSQLSPEAKQEIIGLFKHKRPDLIVGIS